MENEQNITIKERREQKRQEKLIKKETTEGAKAKSRIAMWLGVVVILGAAVLGLVLLVKNAPKPIQYDLPVAILDSVTSSDWMRGNTTTNKATLIEYGDFECPACGQYYPVVKKLEQDFGKDVKFVFRNFPLSQHVNARVAARAAEAAGVQGKFWEMHDLLYEGQDEWTGKGSAITTFVAYATKLGLNIDQFKKDYESKEIGAKIDADVASGNKYGVDATPTFYLDNTKLAPKSYDELKQAITDEINKKP